MNKKLLVALTRGLDVQENVTRVFDIMSDAAKMIEPNSIVVLKLNAEYAAPPELAVHTHPETVHIIIREVKKANPKRIVVAKAAAVDCDTDECCEACDIAAVTQGEGVELVNIKKDKDLVNITVWSCRSNISHVKLPCLLLEAEHVINLPILKAHASMVSSGALKNIKGVVQGQVHVQIHQRSLVMVMMDVWRTHRADTSIVDVMHVVSDYSPYTLMPIEMGCIIGSYDPVTPGRVAYELVDINPDNVDHFHMAWEAGLGATSRDDIEMVGSKVADYYKKMWVPYLEGIRNRQSEYEVHCEGICSSCQALLTLNMETSKAIGVHDNNTDMVAVVDGRNTLFPDTLGEKILLHGNYARKRLKERPDAFSLRGCPPGEGSLYTSALRGEAMTGKPKQMYWICERMKTDAPAWHLYVEKEAEKFYGPDDK